MVYALDGLAHVSGPYQTESPCVLPQKSRNLRERSRIAWSSVPYNAAHQWGIAYATGYSAMQSKPDDEQMHGFARSRSQCENVASNYRAEMTLQPMHYPSLYNKPMDAAFTSQSDRVVQYAQLRPVGAGRYASSSWFPQQ